MTRSRPMKHQCNSAHEFPLDAPDGRMKLYPQCATSCLVLLLLVFSHKGSKKRSLDRTVYVVSYNQLSGLELSEGSMIWKGRAK